MVEVSKVTIEEVLSNSDYYKWSDSLFLPEPDEWVLDTKGIVRDSDAFISFNKS